MKKLTQAALVAVAVALSAGTVAHVTPAKAEVAVTFNSGDVAFGYNDGYWDRSHAWHAWPSEQTRTTYQTSNHDHYFDRRHDVDKDSGWHDNDHWWEHH
jgi:hypothetical protein